MSDRSLEQRMNIKLCVKTGKSASETFFLLQQAYGEHSMDESSVFEWHQRLTEQENLLDQAKSAHRKPQKNTEANKNNGQNLVRSDPRLDVQIKSEEVKINREAVQQNAVEHLGMRNIPAKMEHRLLTEDDKKHRPGISPALFSNKENVSSVNEESPMETESSSGADVLRSDSSRQDLEEDELDGLPVFGADEEESELESRSTHAEKQSGDGDKNNDESSVSPKNHEAGESVQCSQQEEELQNKGSASPPESGAGSREEVLFSPLKKIKDEPIDEDYDKALISSAHSDISRVKEELENGDHELSDTLDDLRISSVFSVRGNSDAITASVAAPQLPAFSAVTQPAPAIRPPPIVLQAQMQPQFQAHLQLQPKTLAQLQPHLQTQLQAQLQTHLQPQLQLQAQLQAQLQPQPTHQLQPQLSNQLQPQLSHQLQPQTQPPPPPQTQPTHQLRTKPSPQQQPPPAPVRICCSGCSKVLQKGQTAFQKKGSNQLFCSTVCLTGFNLPPAPIIAPKKTCHLCLKVIGNPKDLIIVPVDAANTLKEFCSLSCLSIYKSRVEGLPEENAVVRCSMCRNPSEIQHEVNHQGILHRLCSDDCFSRFRSSKRLSMSCCESCGNCTVTGNYHLVQIEDAVKKFCSLACISSFKQKSGKRVHCPCCQDLKAVDQMMEGTNAQGVIEFFCSSRCVANSEASCTLSGASFPCTNCQKLAVPQYHLAMPDGAIRNFCSYECVDQFQEKLHKSMQMNGGPYHSSNTDLHPSVPHHPSAQVCHPLPNAVPQNQNTASPYVPVSRLTNPQDPQQPEVLVPVKLTCKRCQKQFSSKPEVLQFKNHVGLFCSRFCCDMYKREKDVKAVCEYCKEEKVAKEIIVYEKQLRTFCCEGCKLLYKHDYARQHGGQWKVCAYCCNVTHKTIQNHFGGKLEEFCSEKCMSLYTVLFYEMAKCSACKNQGPLKESLRWDETARHFCNLQCLLHFCSKNILPDQPNSNGINPAATTAQAPLSLSKDVPVIGGVVSLASALAGNTALTGALPTSNASSKIIGDASTQTDASVNGDPQQRRMLKNKAVMCKPISDDQGIQSDLEPPKFLSETVIDENGEKIRLVPMPVPIPTPVFIPVPMHLYAQYTPVPLGFPLPIPVPLIWPASQDSAQASSTKGSVPSQSSVEDEDLDKGKSRPLSHADQGSTYSGDLESDARSTPFSWAEPDDSAHSHVKTPITLSELEGPKDAPATSTASCLLDLENDIPLASNDNDETKEQKYSAKRRKRGKRRSKVEELKNFKEELDVADCAQFILDSNLEKFTASSCQQDETLERSLSISPECAPIEDDLDEAENSEELNSSFKAMVSSLPSLKTGTEASCTKKQFCVYCKKSNSKIARHLTQMHSNETDVAYALNFPKNSKSRHVLLERLRKRGNYYHNVEVIRNGNEDIVLQKRTKRKRSSKDYLPCRYCLGFFVRNGLEKHEYSCRTKKLPEKFLESLQELDLKNESCFHTTREIDAPSFVNLIQLQNPGSSSESTSCPNLVSTLQSSLDRSLLTDQSSAEFSDQTDLKPGFGPSYMFSQSSPEPFLPTSSNFGRSPEANFCTSTCSPEPCPQSGFDSYFQFNDLSSPATNNANPNQSSVITDECNPEAKKTDFELCLPSTPEPGPPPYTESSPSHSSFDLCFKEDLVSHSETPCTPEYCSIDESSKRISPATSEIYADGFGHENQNAELLDFPVTSLLSSTQPTHPGLDFCNLANVGCDLREPASPQMSQQSPFVSSHESTLQSTFESCTQAEKTSCCSPTSCQQSSHVGRECNPYPIQTSFELGFSFYPEASHETKPSSQISFQSHFETGFQSHSESSLSPVPESFCYQDVQSNLHPTNEACLTSTLKCNSPLPSSLDSNTEFKIGASSHCLDSNGSDLISSDRSDKPPEKSSTCQKKPLTVDEGDPILKSSSCMTTNSQCETASTHNLKNCSVSLSSLEYSPHFGSNLTLSRNTSSKLTLSRQIPLNNMSDESLQTKRQFCFYCKKPCIKMARHLSQKHAKEMDVARALRFRKGSKKRLLLFEQIRKKGNYQHNVEVLKNGSGELITYKRARNDQSMYLPCQYCLGFYVGHDLWRHERHCKLKTNDDPVCLKRTRHQSTVLLPFQEGASGDLEEAIRRMKEDAVSKHIREDALICKYGARLFVNLKHRKKHQMYVSQRMRDLAKFMLAVKELDGSVQYLHHVCTLSRYDLVIKAAKIFCEFDESLSKFKRPSLAFRIGKSVRQAAEIVCGENVMEGNTETVADVKQFIKLLEKHWIFPAKNADWVNPDSSDVNGCLDKPTKALSSCQKKPPLRNRKSAFSAHRHGPKNEENVDSNEKLLCSNNAKESSTNPAVQSSMSHRSKSPSKSEVLTLKLRTARSKNKHFCLYCRKPVFKLARHLSLIHAKKKDVAHILSYPKGSKMRRCLFKQLLTKGNYQHNVRVQHTGKGEIIPIKRKQKDNSLKSHQACSFCLGFYHPSDLWRHLKSCRMKTDDTISCRRRSCSAPSKNFVLHESLSQGCQNVVRSMRDDKVSKYLRNDSLICKFGNRLYEEGDLCIPQKMRALGRFMLAVKELDPTVMDLNQVCTESRFDLASEAVKKVGGFEPNSRHKFKQSVALRIAFSLKCATEIALEEKGLGGKVRNQAKTFIKLLEKEWLLKEPSNPCKKTEENIIPLIEDVVKLQNYLKNFEDKAISELTEHPNCNSWKRLRESLLAELTLFNRERRSIAEKMLLQEYMQRDGNLIREKMCEPLTKLEQALNAVLITVGITCKDGSWIPVAFTARMAASLDILIKYRKDVGVPTHNPYMFPKMTTDSHIRAHDYIRIFARNCGVSKPEVHMHKQVATVFKIRSLNAIEKQQAAALVGDGAFDLQTPDENVSQLAKICNLLQTIEEGPEAQKVMGLGDSPRCKRQKWSPEEQEAVMRQLGNYISISKVPGKKDCLACIKTEFEALNKRTWLDVKNFIYNTIRFKKSKKRSLRQTDSESKNDNLGEAVAMEAAAKRPRLKRRPRRRV